VKQRRGSEIVKFWKLGFVVAVIACIRTAPVPVAQYWVSSDSSQYSPIARFRVHSAAVDAGFSVAIDSASIAIPGTAIADAPPVMSQLYLTAIIAVPDSGSLAVVRAASGRRPAERRGWRPIATSDSVLLIDQLRYGERARISDIRLLLPATAKLPEGPLWMIFRISGNTVELAAPLVAGGQPRRHDLSGGVQVYACGDRDLLGKFDAARGASLKRAYGIAC
jgi:hypothetical protein